MKVGDNGSGDSEEFPDDDIVNIRDVIVQNSSSSEDIERSNIPPQSSALIEPPTTTDNSVTIKDIQHSTPPTQSALIEPSITTDNSEPINQPPNLSHVSWEVDEEMSFEVDEIILPPAVVSRPPPPKTSNWRHNKTLGRFLEAVGSISNLYTRAAQRFANDVLPVDFVDGVDISSDEAKDNWSVEDGNDQLDSEWLELSHTDIHNKDTERLTKSTDNPPSAGLKRVTAFFYPLKFTNAMLPVYKALLYLGRFPFEVDVSEEIPRYKYNNKSWRYFLFVGTSVITFGTAILMLVNLVNIVTAAEPLTLHETAARLEQEKFWIEATLEILNLLFLALSSVSMLGHGGGTSIVDFLNRWSAALGVIRYDVTSGLRNICTGFFCCYGIYAGTFVLLFFVGGQRIPTVRGSCGFNGLLILNSFTDYLRFEPRFRVAEFLGLFVHLYTTLATSLVTLVICLHCWALNNAAKRFNERLAGCLRSVGFMKASQAYSKIFEEHLMVSSFPKQIGKVYRLALLAYLGCKMVEMTVTLFGVAEPIVNGFPESEEEFLNVTGQSSFDPEKTIPIQVVEPSQVQALKSGFYVAKTWIPWLIFMEIVQKPGSSLMRGAGLIVRNSLRHSRSSHALRFITSMEFSFNSRIAFNVNPGVTLTREFTGKFAAFSLVIFVTLIQFIPSAVNSEATVICDHLGECILFHFPAKLKSRDGFRDSIGKVVKEEQKATTQPPPPSQPPPSNFVLSYPPCLSSGRLPQGPPNYAFKCKKKATPVYIPTYFRKSSDRKFIQVPPTPDRSCVQSSNLTKGETLFDCFGDRVSSLQADECGNPKLATPDATGAKQLPILRAVRLNREIFCCFVYSGLENQAERCNLLSTPTHSCSRKSGTPGRRIHEESIVQLWNESSTAFVDNQLPLWTGCLCQGLQGLPISSTACTALPTTTTTSHSTPSRKPTVPPTPSTTHKPTTSSTTPTIPTTTSPYKPDGPCPSATHPKDAWKTCPDPRSIFRTHFLSSCPLGGAGIFAIPSVANLQKSGDLSPPFTYPCRKQTSASRLARLPSPLDCYGNKVNLRGIDDCGTVGVSFPSRFDGTERQPKMKVERLGSGPRGRSVTFLCCWDYKEWQDVTSKCNTYPGSDLTKVCGSRTVKSKADAVKWCAEVQKSGRNDGYRQTCFRSSLSSPPGCF